MKRVFIFLFIAWYSAVSFGQSQGRAYIKNKIREWGQCKNVAITIYGGDVAVYGKNGWAASGAPSEMTRRLRELHNEGVLIDDIVLTERGSWLILYGINGFTYAGIPSSLEYKLKQWNNQGEVITSVTFNDEGDWIAITKTKYAASSSSIIDFLKDGESRHGELWAACVTNDGLVACYARGYKFLGNVPNNLKNKLGETSIDVFRIKFLGDGAYFFADTRGNYYYYL